jgi:hypothetical protein
MPGYALIGHMGAGDVAADLEGRWHAQYRSISWAAIGRSGMAWAEPSALSAG